MKAPTITDKLLLACLELAPDGDATFTAEQLAVKAWQLFPDAFGLQGYADEYPDSNRVFTYIMGSKGLAGAGHIERTGQKIYRLTARGLEAASRLVPEQHERAMRGALMRPRMSVLARLRSSRAFTKYSQGRRGQITPRDALLFLGVTVRAKPKRVKTRLDEIEDALAAAEAAIAGGIELSIAWQHGGDALSAEDVGTLRDCYGYVRAAFADEISQMLTPRRKRAR